MAFLNLVKNATKHTVIEIVAFCPVFKLGTFYPVAFCPGTFLPVAICPGTFYPDTVTSFTFLVIRTVIKFVHGSLLKCVIWYNQRHSKYGSS